jgi:hypothetical protein
LAFRPDARKTLHPPHAEWIVGKRYAGSIDLDQAEVT